MERSFNRYDFHLILYAVPHNVHDGPLHIKITTETDDMSLRFITQIRRKVDSLQPPYKFRLYN